MNLAGIYWFSSNPKVNNRRIK